MIGTMTVKKDNKSLTKRTLYYFWKATKKIPHFFLLDILSTFGYVALLTYANNYCMGKMVDMTGSMTVGPGEVFQVYGPYIIAMILINATGQVCSKLQDYACWKLEIHANYEMASFCFDTLPHEPLWRSAGQPDLEIHELVFALSGNADLFRASYQLFCDYDSYHADAAGTGLCGGASRHAHSVYDNSVHSLQKGACF